MKQHLCDNCGELIPKARHSITLWRGWKSEGGEGTSGPVGLSELCEVCVDAIWEQLVSLVRVKDTAPFVGSGGV